MTATEPTIAAYGTWASPISAASLAEGVIVVSDLRVAAEPTHRGGSAGGDDRR